jgi:NTE family protein
LSAFDDDLKKLFIPGGQILFHQNEAADAFYIVMAGCLGVIVQDNDGRETLIASISAGGDGVTGPFPT